MKIIVKSAARVAAVPHELIGDPRVSNREFRLWALLDLYGDEASRLRLACDLGCEETDVDRAVDVLRRLGWIEA